MAAELGFNIVAHNRASKGIQAVARDFQGLEKKVTAAGKDSGKGFARGLDIGGIASKMKGGLVGAGLAAGAAAGAALKEGIDEALKVGEITAGIGAQLAIDPAVARDAGKVAGRVYGQGWGESLDQVKTAAVGVVQNLNTQIGDADFKPLVTNALAFSDVFDQDVTRSIQTVGRLMKTGMVKDGREGFDTLTALFQKAGTQTDDLLDTLIEYPVQLKQLGLSAEEAAGLLIQGLQGGARDSDKVADALKELRIRVVDLTAEEGLKKLGLDAEEMADAFARGGPVAREALGTILTKLRGVKDPAERARIAVELFGTQAEDLAGALNRMDLSKARGELGKVEAATINAGNTAADSVWGQWAIFKRGVGGALSGLVSGDLEKFDNSVRDVMTREIPGHASVATGAISGFARSTNANMGLSRNKIRGVASAAGDMKGALERIPRHTKADVSANTRPFWSSWRGIVNTPLNKTVNLTTSGAAFFALLGAVRKEHGGPVEPNRAYLVGERGQELFVPDRPGTVIPHGESMRMLDGAAPRSPATSTSQVVNVYVSAPNYVGSAAELIHTLRKELRARGGNVQAVLGP